METGVGIIDISAVSISFFMFFAMFSILGLQIPYITLNPQPIYYILYKIPIVLQYLGSI